MGEAKRRREAAKVVLPNGIRLVTNKPTPEGYHLGALFAGMADEGEPLVRLSFPAHAPRCKSCAFTNGTLPNGCPETVLDAFASIVEDTPFMCHQRFDDDGNPEDLCAGWAFAKEAKMASMLKQVTGGKLPFEVPVRSPGVQAYMDEMRRKIRAKKGIT